MCLFICGIYTTDDIDLPLLWVIYNPTDVISSSIQQNCEAENITRKKLVRLVGLWKMCQLVLASQRSGQEITLIDLPEIKHFNTSPVV